MTDFSVSLCTYNGDSSKYLNQALQSIVDQTKMPNEIVIVVDGPIRVELDRVIGDFADENAIVKVVRLDKNMGHGIARRTGLDSCSNEIVALMDADDISLPDRFERQLARFEANPDLGIVGGTIEEFRNVAGEVRVCSIRELPERDADIKALMKWRCPVNQPTVMFRRSDVEAAGGYIDWYCNEDYYLWVRMALNGAKFENVPDVILRFRVDDETYRRRGGLKYFQSEARLQYFIFKSGLSNPLILIWNVAIRFGVQVLCPASVRKYLYTRVFRSDAGAAEALT